MVHDELYDYWLTDTLNILELDIFEIIEKSELYLEDGLDKMRDFVDGVQDAITNTSGYPNANVAVSLMQDSKDVKKLIENAESAVFKARMACQEMMAKYKKLEKDF